MDYYDYCNRTLCAVLDEMRKCCESRNFSYLPGLIEEAQSMGNKMEGALSDKRDIAEWTQKRSKLKKELNDLRQKLDSLKAKKVKHEGPKDLEKQE